MIWTIAFTVSIKFRKWLCSLGANIYWHVDCHRLRSTQCVLYFVFCVWEITEQIERTLICFVILYIYGWKVCVATTCFRCLLPSFRFLSRSLSRCLCVSAHNFVYSVFSTHTHTQFLIFFCKFGENFRNFVREFMCTINWSKIRSSGSSTPEQIWERVAVKWWVEYNPNLCIVHSFVY